MVFIHAIAGSNPAATTIFLALKTVMVGELCEMCYNNSIALRLVD